MNQNEISNSKSETGGKKITKKQQQPEMMMSELLSAISETEYPAYILEAAKIVQEWMNDAVNRNKHDAEAEPLDIFAEFFGQDLTDDTGSIEDLYSRLNSLEEFADVIPNSKKSGEKSDTIIISLAPPDYEGGLRAAIDHAAIFNRGKCHRVWIFSDSFNLDDVVRFIPHVDALIEQGISLRFLLITPWGWVELPLSGSTVSRQQFLWKTENSESSAAHISRRKRKH